MMKVVIILVILLVISLPAYQLTKTPGGGGILPYPHS
ncbi:hypothetical protein DS621_08320 [Salmonella enterica subsp. enterica serovar Teshie]|nr:hypothetical protein [Salmonella enterica subsp. enterica serovar Teshie]EBU9726008.1 hypothetical protein [Salmonella enterica subsp. enterica serovar Teshie]EBV3611405.1 hypothetical protein [Salmonella enterica subsp. enterica serovar Teshie]ECB5042544.1 type I toxin-antitoxin system Ibs family toxin [Salmonella enterica subsp. enterica serovar Teshie]ECD2691494.1 type I toxin-antitoxin system Ibs family toxin [Salmonella enterica subsp. enterica serovar Teshie]